MQMLDIQSLIRGNVPEIAAYRGVFSLLCTCLLRYTNCNKEAERY